MAIPSLIADYLPLLAAASLVSATALSWWGVLWPRLALGCLFVSLLIGQVVRFSLPGQGGGILLSDIAVVLVLCAAVFQAFRHKRAKIFSPIQHQKSNTGVPMIAYQVLIICPFLLWSLFTLVIHAPSLSAEATLVSAAYWLRLASHLLLLPALLMLNINSWNYRFLKAGFMVTALVLALGGIAQWIFYSDLTSFTSQGWDPHQGRLVSSWLDPNFIGGFLSMALVFYALQQATGVVIIIS
ncbi:MAG: hypothetical protein ACRD4B_08780, partial [Acidobacteriota bacterium]